MNELTKAYFFAQKAHLGQVDKGGNDYFLHPLAVSGKVKAIPLKVIALLHDVIEDTVFTADDLKSAGFSARTILAVTALSRKKGESYDDYLLRLSINHDAVIVKIADLEHNADLSRISAPTQKDFARTQKYREKLGFLKKIQKNF
ncbi:GTP pyrophosphokinase [Caproicibacterium sp. NSD3]